ncbi:MAG TPA: CDP-diacylglycerol--glycerol-3-phosphate 3-phosphatidyltransferase [Pirellulales bacterium]|nr:CDP-diacylglycerol--glycerol-3-phosphate 3-phosphatidyltransferase [Pirellulales bacterium]
MSVATKNSTPEQVFNVPNQITGLRLVLSIVLFVLLPCEYYLTGMVVFIVAAATDWVDGYYARKYGQVTTLGRILDPFVDKIIICGSFIYLAAVVPGPWGPGSGIAAWMAVVVVGRELLVTALRTFLEGEGADFSATMSGKLKMVFQCTAVGVSIFGLTYGAEPRPDWLVWLLRVSVWSAVALTVYSGLEYVRRAALLMRR